MASPARVCKGHGPESLTTESFAPGKLNSLIAQVQVASTKEEQA